MGKTTTWRKLIGEKLQNLEETWDDVESSTLTEKELDIKFDDGFGGSEGKSFTLWTKKYVFFPVVYDGSEWVESVSRSPDGVATEHFGGE